MEERTKRCGSSVTCAAGGMIRSSSSRLGVALAALTILIGMAGSSTLPEGRIVSSLSPFMPKKSVPPTSAAAVRSTSTIRIWLFPLFVSQGYFAAADRGDNALLGLDCIFKRLAFPCDVTDEKPDPRSSPKSRHQLSCLAPLLGARLKQHRLAAITRLREFRARHKEARQRMKVGEQGVLGALAKRLHGLLYQTTPGGPAGVSLRGDPSSSPRTSASRFALSASISSPPFESRSCPLHAAE